MLELVKCLAATTEKSGLTETKKSELYSKCKSDVAGRSAEEPFAEYGEPLAEKFYQEQKPRNKERAKLTKARTATKKAEKTKGERERILTKEVSVKKGRTSESAIEFLEGLMTRRVKNRLGCGSSGFDDIKGHEFFKNIDWDLLEKGMVEPPFIPKKEVNASHEADLKKFDTRGMKKLTKEDQEKYHKWEWCDTGLVEAEVAKYLYADLWAGAGDAGEAKDGEKGGGGCCEIL